MLANARIGRVAAGVAAGLGVALVAGSRSRALRERTSRLTRRSLDAFEDARAHAAHRIGGRLRQGVSRIGFWRRGDVDQRIEARVRSLLGRVVERPRAVDVTAHEGTVTLQGSVKRAELRRLLARVRAVRGVAEVENRLEVVERHGPAASRETGSDARGRSALGRVALGGSGVVLAAWGVSNRSLVGGIVSALGLGLFVRSLVGSRRSPRASDIDVHKTIYVGAPVEDVYRFWNDFQNWPRFMEHLDHVELQPGERSHWTATAPFGLRVSWDAEVTERRPNRLIAWNSLPGSMVSTSGRVRFDRQGRGTRISVVLHYRPPAGALGHVVASLFGDDPQHAMTEDLAHLKQLLEGAARGGATGFESAGA